MTSTLRAPTGFEEAFDGLFGRAFRVAMRILRDPTAAEDVAAETMARAFAHWRKIGDQPWREGWVVRVASNLAIDTARARSRMSDAPLQEISHEDDDVALRLALVDAMARLPKRQREVVALRHLAGLSEAETAAALRVSAGSVKTHLHRGLAALRARLGAEVPGIVEGVARDV
ncbi:MAG TPA: sigma-70 family RNA polymerase sigma factor [Acidimicrobiia bacterium]|nr:sigma-70 family RNA polymerase sigma factor [Acidimicrobiia bacterium]